MARFSIFVAISALCACSGGDKAASPPAAATAETPKPAAAPTPAAPTEPAAKPAAAPAPAAEQAAAAPSADPKPATGDAGAQAVAAKADAAADAPKAEAAAAPAKATQIEGVPDPPAKGDAPASDELKAKSQELAKQAKAASKEKKHEAARDLLVQALEADPGNPKARYALAKNSLRLRDSSKSIAVLKQLRKMGCKQCKKLLKKARRGAAFESLWTNRAFRKAVRR